MLVVLKGLLEVIILITTEEALFIQHLEVGYGFFGLSKLKVEFADVLVRAEVSGFEAQGFTVVREGFVHPVEFTVAVAEQVVNVRIVRLALQCYFES